MAASSVKSQALVLTSATATPATFQEIFGALYEYMARRDSVPIVWTGAIRSTNSILVIAEEPSSSPTLLSTVISTDRLRLHFRTPDLASSRVREALERGAKDVKSGKWLRATLARSLHAPRVNTRQGQPELVQGGSGVVVGAKRRRQETELEHELKNQRRAKMLREDTSTRDQDVVPKIDVIANSDNDVLGDGSQAGEEASDKVIVVPEVMEKGEPTREEIDNEVKPHVAPDAKPNVTSKQKGKQDEAPVAFGPLASASSSIRLPVAPPAPLASPSKRRLAAFHFVPIFAPEPPSPPAKSTSSLRPVPSSSFSAIASSSTAALL